MLVVRDMPADAEEDPFEDIRDDIEEMWDRPKRIPTMAVPLELAVNLARLLDERAAEVTKRGPETQ